jgi:hypothetical protein
MEYSTTKGNSPVAMDYLFRHLPKYGAMICRTCRIVVFPDQAETHLRNRHLELSRRDRQQILRDFAALPALYRSDDDAFHPLRAIEEPIEGLELFSDGLQCRIDPAVCFYVCRTEKSMCNHWRSAHAWHLSIHRGRHTPNDTAEIQQRRADARRAVRCQRLSTHGRHGRYFAVRYAPTGNDSKSDEGDDSVVGGVLRELAMIEQEQDQQGRIVAAQSSVKEVSPWLEMTRWPVYLSGCDLLETALLIAPARPDTEPVLYALEQSLERIVEEAYCSVCNDRINVFDQARINSFLQHPRACDRPLVVKLQKSTWRSYTRVWKALLGFVYRTQQPEPIILLKHRLTTRQLCNLSEAIRWVEALLFQGSRLPTINTAAATAICETTAGSKARIDQSCLDLCISLLDHDIRGDLFESVVVGFFAVLGIDTTKGILKEAYHYTSSLSGFMKIAQMLVLQKAVVAAANGQVAQPADLLDEMRARFLIHGTRSPFN